MKNEGLNKKNIGTVLEVRDGIVYANGLENVGFNEFVEIHANDINITGIALNLEQSRVGIISLGDYKMIKEGDEVVAKNILPSINVNESYLGRVVDALGKPIDGKGEVDQTVAKKMMIERVAPGIIERQDVTRSLQTGILAIDSLTSIGLGQRQLIIGDRQIGKTTIALDTLINLKNQNIVGIYVAIGQKTSKTAALISKLKEAGVFEKCIVVNASASDPASMQYIAPFTATAIGEYFAEQGSDAVIIYDDLTKHANAYREISLLLKRPSGREAFPGDVFYLHSRLLERSLQYNDEKGGGSLTALPIIETLAGDISAYVPTNVISITDGQVFLDPDLYNSGQKPAISTGLSVSRVGGAAQTKALKQYAGQLKMELAQYRELAAFSQLGSELDPVTKKSLDRGARITELMKQEKESPRDLRFMIMLLLAVKRNLLEMLQVEQIKDWAKYFESKARNVYAINTIDAQSKVDEGQEEILAEIIKSSIEEYLKLKFIA